MALQKISELPPEERPAYKIEKYPEALSSRELLALLVGGENQMEIADKLYASCNGNLSRLGQDTTLEDIEGIGKATSDRILAAIKLGQKSVLPQDQNRIVIQSPEDAADLVQYEMSALSQEELRVILLNTRNHVIKVVTIYRGSLNSSQVRIGEIFRPAVKHNAAAIILVHNHPSSEISPSSCDIGITRAILKAGKLLDIDCLDHLIIGGNTFVSLNRRGLGFGGQDEPCLDFQSESTDNNSEPDDSNEEPVENDAEPADNNEDPAEIYKERGGEKRVVAMSKPLPKMLRDLKKSELKAPGAVQLVVGKKGNVIATTLRDQVVEKETKK